MTQSTAIGIIVALIIIGAIEEIISIRKLSQRLDYTSNYRRNYMTSPQLFEEKIYLLVSTCDEALTKHIGLLTEAIEIGYSKLRNPFSCFANGIRFVISLPIHILEWCGIINSNTSKRIINSRLQEIINKIVVLIGLISSLITIIMGWDTFIQIVKTILRLG